MDDSTMHVPSSHTVKCGGNAKKLLQLPINTVQRFIQHGPGRKAALLDEP